MTREVRPAHRTECARTFVGVAIAVVIVAAAGCANPPPVVIEAAVVSDTNIEAGPYEVRVLAADEDGIGASKLHWEASGPLTVDKSGDVVLVPVVADAVDPDVVRVGGTRLSAAIPGAPLGTEIRWRVSVCDAGRRCTLSPDDGRNFVFHVGLVPSSPVVRSLEPDHGPSSGGTRVLIHGSDFRPGSVARFGNVVATHVEWLRDDLILATTSAQAPSIVDVSVENPDGVTGTLPDSFTFTPSPILILVDPASGPEAGGTAVIIAGGNFTADARAFFDGIACRDVVVKSDAEIDCDTPPGHHGLVDVEVRALDGGRGVIPDGFEYIQAPTVDFVDPDSGSSDGGDVVIIGGDGFRDGATVTIGGAPCTNVIVGVDGTQIACTTPAGAPGAADVVVENSDGQSDTLPGGFGFIGPPVVVEVVPPLVPLAGGKVVRVLGAGFSSTDTVTFGGAPGVVVGTSGAAELDVRVPAVPADPAFPPPSGLLAVDVVVQRNAPNDARSGSLSGGLTYFWPPEVDLVTPPEGPTTGGTDIVITGRFFHAVDGQPVVVTLTSPSAGGAPPATFLCNDVVVLASTTITCTTPPGDPGFDDVSVANEDDSKGTAARAYFYIAPPRVDSVDPPEGPTFGGDVVTIHGDFFEQGALAFFDGAPCSGPVVVDAQTMTCTTPPDAEGSADVRVLNPDGQEGTGAGIYRYLGVVVTPDHGLPAGFTFVHLRTAGVQTGATVTFGGVTATCTVISARELTCQSPAHNRGDVNVTFTNPDGTTETGTGAFHYRTYVEHQGDFPVNGENCNDVDLADFDGDGDLDAVVATGNVFFDQFDNLTPVPQDSGVWENDGTGHFTRHDIGVFTVANNSSVADADGDGKPDILIGATNGTGPFLMINDGNFNFHQRDLGLNAFDDSFDAEFVDVVGDGRADIYNLSSGCDPNDPNSGGNCDPSIIGPDNLLEQVNGGFNDDSSLVPHSTDWVHDHKLIAADIDGDGANDVVIVTNNTTFPSEQNRVMMNRTAQGQGFVATTPSDLLNLFGDLYDLEAGDIDGDGDPDIITTICAGDFGEALLRNNDGVLTLDNNALPGITPGACTVGAALVDLDDDGDLDLLFGGTVDLNDTHTAMRVLINKGDGTFVEASDALPDDLFNHHLQIDNFAAGDIDGDHDVDILVAGGAPYFEPNRNGRVVVLRLE